MNAIDLAKSIVDRLVLALPSIKCRYEYAEISDTHMIEVLPLSVYNSVAFEEVAEPLLMEFISQFMGESLCFVSEENLSLIEAPIYEATGSQYDSAESEKVLYQAATPSQIAKKRVEVRVNLHFYEGLPEKINVSSNINPGESEYAMAA